MQVNHLYLAGLFGLNLAFTWGAASVWLAWRRRGLISGVLQAALLVMLATTMAQAYRVLPAVWWPGGIEAYVDSALDCMGIAAASLVVHAVAQLKAVRAARRAAKQSPAGI